MFTTREQLKNMNEKIVDRALARLTEQLEIKATWNRFSSEVDGEILLHLKGNGVRLFIEVTQELRKQQIPHLLELAKRYQPLVVVAENIFPTLKKTLREKNIGYMDTAGNVCIRGDNIYIWVDGKPVEKALPVKNRAFTKTGLKAVFYLLLQEDAINLPYRKIAEATGVALGNIRNIIEGLRQADFILPVNEDTLKLKNRKALLDRWVAGYRETLKPTLHLGNYVFWKKDKRMQWKELDIENDKAVWGGEPAAAILTKHLRPEILTVYTEANKTNIANKWKLLPMENGDIKMYQKFWANTGFANEDIVPTLLIYADLMITNDPRCVETAHIIYEKYLKDEFEKY